MRMASGEESSIKKPFSLYELVNSQQLSLAAGAGGLLLLLLNRVVLLGEMVSDVQSRSDLISTIACSALLLNAFSEQEVETKVRDKVSLIGHYIKGRPFLYKKQPLKQQRALKWAVITILNNCPVTSAHVIAGDMILAAGGITGSYRMDDDAPIELATMPILQKSVEQREEVYLPDLQVIPGKLEFSYLPLNCQSVAILPLPAATTGAGLQRAVVVIGTNQAKVLTQRDLRRIRAVLSILNTLL